MTMELEFEQTLAPHFGTQQKVSPRLVAANHILELSSQQLQQAIATELSENPAVELVDEPLCHVCGTALHGSICPRCIQRQKGHESPTDRYSSSPDDVTARGSDEDDFDPMTRVASEQTRAEKLVSDMAAVLSERDLPIGEYLVGSLDDQGYLSVKVDDVAYELAVDAAHVQAVLRVLQAQDPIGIGARTLRECLLIQIDHLDERGVRQPHAREIVSQFLTELGEHKFSKIAHELRISTSAVASAWDFVKQELNPHPAHGFSGTNPRIATLAPCTSSRTSPFPEMLMVTRSTSWRVVASRCA